jgi:hypothetical protein
MDQILPRINTDSRGSKVHTEIQHNQSVHLIFLAMGFPLRSG